MNRFRNGGKNVIYYSYNAKEFLLRRKNSEVIPVKSQTIDNRTPAVLVATVIFCAILARALGNNGFLSAPCGLVRSLLYISLYLGWGISMRRRVIQPQVRRYLSVISFLMVFWFIVRTCKYGFAPDLNGARYLWYSYYFPMLFIPLLAVFVAMSLGKQDDFRLPGWTRLLYVPTVLLVLLVLTNDLHQWVFSFPLNEVWTDKSYALEPGYYIIFGWEVLCGVTALAAILLKSRQSQQKRHLPGLIMLCSVIYALIYVSGAGWLRMLAGDITAAQCLMVAGILESCLQTGLIPTNTGYDALFEAATAGMQIVDGDCRVCYSSAAAGQFPKEAVIQAENGGCLLDEATVLRGYPISGGHIIWQEDISDLIRARECLSAAREELEDRNEILRSQYRRDAQRYRLEEQNRLYDLVQRETQKQLREIDALADRFGKAEQGFAERETLLLRILVLATYIKRHKDMVISSDRSRTVPVHLLEGALQESCGNLSLGNIGGNLYLPCAEALLPVQAALAAYDLFEDALELALDTLRYYFITVSEEDDGALCLHIEMECGDCLSPLAEVYPDAAIQRDEESWFITRVLTTGGDGA